MEMEALARQEERAARFDAARVLQATVIRSKCALEWSGFLLLQPIFQRTAAMIWRRQLAKCTHVLQRMLVRQHRMRNARRIQACVRSRAASQAHVLACSAAIRLQACICRTLVYVRERERERIVAASLLQSAARIPPAIRLLGKLKEKERLRIEEARKKRLLNNTDAAKAVSKVSPRVLKNWQSMSEPYQNLPFHGPTPATSSLLGAQRRAEENQKQVEDAEAELEQQRLANQRLRDQLLSVTQQAKTMAMQASLSEADDSDDSGSDFSESSEDQVLNAEMDMLESKLKVSALHPAPCVSCTKCIKVHRCLSLASFAFSRAHRLVHLGRA